TSRCRSCATALSRGRDATCGGGESAPVSARGAAFESLVRSRRYELANSGRSWIERLDCGDAVRDPTASGVLPVGQGENPDARILLGWEEVAENDRVAPGVLEECNRLTQSLNLALSVDLPFDWVTPGIGRVGHEDRLLAKGEAQLFQSRDGGRAIGGLSSGQIHNRAVLREVLEKLDGARQRFGIRDWKVFCTFRPNRSIHVRHQHRRFALLLERLGALQNDAELHSTGLGRNRMIEGGLRHRRSWRR